jgi:GDP/UDP-N,N'-diacetylbacillosamine 2-epimerase (hydrolysing)
MKRKICIVTGSRADYGILRGLMQKIDDEQSLELQLVVSGMHLLDQYGSTYEEIQEDGFQISFKVEDYSDSQFSQDASDAVSKGISGCTDAFKQLQPDLVLLLGDRFEVFAAAISAYILNIPIAHLHGGETTVGAFDEGFRHSITKLSCLHFVASEQYRNRVIQLGEHPSRVHLVGGLGVDAISNTRLLSKSDLEIALGIKFCNKSLLVTFHPVTLEPNTSKQQMSELLAALGELEETTIIFTMPNADPGSTEISQLIHEFVLEHINSKVFTSMGQQKYFSCISNVDGVVGNSSSGLTEVPTFKKGTINIGDRQLGRLQAASVINCAPNKKDILESLSILYSYEFQRSLVSSASPYGERGATVRILEILKKIDLSFVVKKSFYDL